MYNLLGSNFIRAMKNINPNAKEASGGREVVFRCPFCGDSNNPNHAHLYLSVPMIQEDISMYQCKKCPAHGIVDESLLRKLGCYDSNTLIDITKHNSEVMKLPKYRTIKNIDVYPLIYPSHYSDKNLSDFKVKYINSRIGSNYSSEDLLRLKIFTNLSDLININNLKLTRDIRVCEKLDINFMGFISYDNSYATMRQVFNDGLNNYLNKRYINYSLIDKLSDSKNFYVIPTSINKYSLEPINIHITEGAFDILSVYHNLNNCNSIDTIYIASGGKSYSQALQFILLETALFNYNIHIYPDRDVSDYELNNLILRDIINLPSSIFIHRNIKDGEKDYGVTKDRIDDSITIIK